MENQIVIILDKILLSLFSFSYCRISHDELYTYLNHYIILCHLIVVLYGKLDLCIYKASTKGLNIGYTKYIL